MQSGEISQELIQPILKLKIQLTQTFQKLEKLEKNNKLNSDELVVLNNQFSSEKISYERLNKQYSQFLELAKTDADFIDMARNISVQLAKIQQKVTSLESYISTLKKASISLRVEIKTVRKEYSTLLDSENIQFNRAVSVIVNQQVKEFKKAKVVKGKAEEFCSRDEIIGDCEKRARLYAEKNALEKGATILINSSTTLKNFELTEDIIKSELQADLSDIIIQKSVAKSLSPLSFEVIITANVIPKVSSTLREQFRQHSAQQLETYKFDSSLFHFQTDILTKAKNSPTPLLLKSVDKVKIESQDPIYIARIEDTKTKEILESSALTNDSTKNKYVKELKAVFSLIDRHDFFTPRRNNAYSKLQAIQDQNYSKVSEAYIMLENSVIDQIEFLTNKNEFDDAEDLLESLSKKYSAKSKFKQLTQNIITKKEQIKSEKALKVYYANAQTAIRKKRFFTPRKKNALHYYQMILIIDSNNPKAKLGIQDLRTKVLSKIDSLISDEDYEDAMELAEAGSKNLQPNKVFSKRIQSLENLMLAKKKAKKKAVNIGW